MQVERSNAAILSAVCKMTFLQEFDWGLMTAGVQPLQRIAFTAGPSTTELLSVNELVAHLNNKLPATRIRVFRIPSRQTVAPSVSC